MEQSDSFDDLLQKFQEMGTVDHDELISQFKQLVCNELSSEFASVILSTTDWNLEKAINYYFDYQSSSKVPQMTLLPSEMANGAFRILPPNTNFTQMWTIFNSGESKWPNGCECICTKGINFFFEDNWIEIESLNPGESTFVTVNMRSPEEEGFYTVEWQMQKPDGLLFGDLMTMEIQVAAA